MAKPSLSIALRYLHYFLTAAEHGSFRKAGAALGVQESSISRRIRDLEDHLGASLFQRYNGGVRLTFAGQRFQRRAEEMVRHVMDSAEDVAAIGRAESGRIKVGILPSLAAGFLAELFRAYNQHHGGVHIDFVEGETAGHAAAIAKLGLDAAFVAGSRPWPECEVTPLWSEQLFVARPDLHRLAGQCVLDWPLLANEGVLIRQGAADPAAGDALTLRLIEAGHGIGLQQQGVGRDTLLPLVAMGRGLALVSEATGSIPFPGIVYRPIAGETLTFSALWSAKNDNPAMRRLLAIARRVAQSIEVKRLR
ncbi:LysR family transcriptional regulator [Rhizobium rhizosphaerae]|uniref:HTH-type transcriptional regulator TtuA n=1 Tax=Xaviernesmea rhizosphaerae TaxID=1672749 RepID=A0A1Q9AGP4_9HYPH|nr:LysR family transcriptional regulator [Xaviernesmea rhizosphaerae]OLP54391.1 LysR family transcriptional regulator [Xaviernesmea rhizosphaerae]